MEEDEIEDDSNIDTSDYEEDMDYETAKDLRADRWQGIRATCMR